MCAVAAAVLLHPSTAASDKAPLTVPQVMVDAPIVALPNVDWTREAVLVVTLGESQSPISMDLTNARRVGLRTEIDLALNWNEGGSAPCEVIAMDKRLARNVRLVNAEAAGLSAQVPAYSALANGLQQQGQATPVIADASWGEVKDMYRQ